MTTAGVKRASANKVHNQALLAKRREQLSQLRSTLVTEIERLTAMAGELADYGAAPDLADEDGLAEGDTINVERERLGLLMADARGRLIGIDLALGRLRDGTYGVCESCGEPIAEARLEAVPEATKCVACKSGGLLRRAV